MTNCCHLCSQSIIFCLQTHRFLCAPPFCSFFSNVQNGPIMESIFRIWIDYETPKWSILYGASSGTHYCHMILMLASNGRKAWMWPEICFYKILNQGSGFISGPHCHSKKGVTYIARPSNGTFATKKKIQIFILVLEP